MNAETHPSDPTPEALLVEYQTAQDSAQHHDNLVWTTTGIIWGSNLILLGFVISSMNAASLRPVITASAIIGLMLCLYVWLAALQFASIRNQKYSRCKDIERILNLQQHSGLRQRVRGQRVFYAIIMLTFIATWIVVLFTVWLA